MTQLFTPINIGSLQLPNKIFMAPMTRGRATPNGTPTEIMSTYYKQRSSAGLIITEATPINPQGVGWVCAPNIYTDQHVEGWKKITQAVKNEGGHIFIQLWHMGRVSHPDFLDGEIPIGPSAIKAQGESHTPNGKKPYVTPREMSIDEITSTIKDYGIAIKRAKEAGFDGVEIHAANGYLLDQFLRDCSNKRSDIYGGSTENRMRLLEEVVKIACTTWEASRIGVRLSPVNQFNDMSDSDPVATFSEVAKMLNQFDLAYLHILEGLPGSMLHAQGLPVVHPHIRKVYNGTLVLNGGYDKETAQTALTDNQADAIAFGVPFISNPDLPHKLQKNLELTDPDFDTFYTPGEKGYTDY